MKAGYSKTIPMAMLIKKHYCHKFGIKLCKNPNTRLVSPHDKEWKKYSGIGRTRMIPIGEIEITEYNFKCPNCEAITEYDEQVVVHKIQKKIKTNTLSNAELEENKEWATNIVKRNKKITSVISKIISILIIAIILLFIIRSGEFEFRF